jgi:signal transduction histidine kinase
MALTIGTSPLARSPGGKFNFEIERLPRHLPDLHRCQKWNAANSSAAPGAASTSGAAVTLKTEFDTSIVRFKADQVQIQQVVHNLVRNAVDAMADVKCKPRVLTCSSRATEGYAW